MNVQPLGKSSRMPVGAPFGWARITMSPKRISDPVHPGSTGPFNRDSTGSIGFLGGETNQWYPSLVEDNHIIDQPYTPEEGYHLSKDLA